MRPGIWRSHPVIGHDGMEYGAGLHYCAGDWAMKMRMLCKLLRKSVRSYWLRPFLVAGNCASLVLGGGENYGSWAENSEARKRTKLSKGQGSSFSPIPPPSPFSLPSAEIWDRSAVRETL
jgi:hypothetical protein